MSNSASQGLYSPLPQSISDTDSEEELHSALPHNEKNKTSNGGDTKSYHHIDDNEDHMNGFPNVNCHTLDDVPIIKDAYKQPMTPLRKLCLASSIIVCFMTVIIFLWVLPCADDATCPAARPKHHLSSWEKDYEGIELMGPINIVNGLPGKCKNLVFLFRSDIIHSNDTHKHGMPNIPQNGGGAISIMGDTGNVAWYIPRQRIPDHIECGLIDVDNNNERDCLITGEKGLFEAVNAQSGKVHWNVHIHPNNKSLFTSIDFPLIILDVNSDRVNDLITACSIDGSKHNIIIFVSGRMGSVLGEPYVASDCENIDSLILEKNHLTYYCDKIDHTRTKTYVPYKDLYSKTINKSYTQHYVPFIKQYYKWDTKKMLRNNFYVNGKKLLINNEGTCPGPKCQVIVQLIDNKGDIDNLTWSYTGKNMYGMIPTKLSFKNSENNLNLQGHVNGYILKFWQWTKAKNSYTPHYIINKNKRSIFESLTKIKSTWRSHEKRSIPIEKNKNLTEVSLEERVMLLTYNATNYKTINASQSYIKQLCSNDEKEFCQPDLASQENSVLLVDLDGDGSQELISYLSTFITVDATSEDNEKSILQTTVKVIRLEKELPKLYESVTKY